MKLRRLAHVEHVLYKLSIILSTLYILIILPHFTFQQPCELCTILIKKKTDSLSKMKQLTNGLKDSCRAKILTRIKIHGSE